MRLAQTRIEFSEDDEFLTIELPVERNGALLALYTVLMLVWIAMLGVTLYYLIQPALPSEVELSFGYFVTWLLLIVAWLVIWVRYIGRMLWRAWRFHVAKRELIYVNKEVFQIHRPAPLRSLADAFDMRYMSPFFANDKYSCVEFQYGKVKRQLFGLGLEASEVPILVNLLNRRFFPFADSEDDEDGFE
jgi:hypothetical protein